MFNFNKVISLLQKREIIDMYRIVKNTNERYLTRAVIGVAKVAPPVKSQPNKT